MMLQALTQTTQAYCSIILKAIPGLKIATDTVAYATNISSLATKISGLVSSMTTMYLCVHDQ